MDEQPVQTPQLTPPEAQPTAIEQTSHNQQIATSFVPTENQIKWFETAVKHATKSPSDVADLMEMDRSTFYRWMDNPKFREWWEAQWAKYYEQMKHRLIEAGARQAATNHTWWRDMMEIMGFAKPKEEVAKPQNTINIMANAFGAKKEVQS